MVRETKLLYGIPEGQSEDMFCSGDPLCLIKTGFSPVWMTWELIAAHLDNRVLVHFSLLFNN